MKSFWEDTYRSSTILLSSDTSADSEVEIRILPFLFQQMTGIDVLAGDGDELEEHQLSSWQRMSV